MSPNSYCHSCDFANEFNYIEVVYALMDWVCFIHLPRLSWWAQRLYITMIIIIFIILVNCHMLFELTKELALELWLPCNTKAYLPQSVIQRSHLGLGSPCPSVWSAHLPICVMGPSAHQDSLRVNTLHPWEQLEGEHYQQVLLMFIPWCESACSGTEKSEVYPGRAQQ